MQLREYQTEAKNKVYRAFKSGVKRVMLQLPTGAGKTILFTSIVRDAVERKKRAWVLVHRKELIEQTVQKAAKYGLTFSVIQADAVYRPLERYQVASVQTLVRRIEKFKKSTFKPDLIICDESHHSTASSYRAIYEAFPEAWLLGVTATPIRTNGEGFADLFDELVTGASMKELIELGYLVKPRYYAAKSDIDLRSIKITAGDYNEADMYEAFKNNCAFGDYVKTWNERAKGKKTICFAINIEHSKQIAQEYNNNGIAAEHVDGTTPKDERDAIMRRFRDGRTLILSNVGIITEGFDVPSCECVQLARATKSLSMYMQMGGRALRPADDKPEAIILDHWNNIYEHGALEWDRQWTLEGIEKRNNRIMVKDLETDRIYEPREAPEHLKEIELVEVDFSKVEQPLNMKNPRIKYLHKQIQNAKDKGYEKVYGYVWKKFINKYQIPTKEEIDMFQQISGFKYGWRFFQYKEFGISA